VRSQDTHALSLVLNVAQHGLREPWPLVVDSMNGSKHAAYLQPGELVFYESARCLHGRETFYQGAEFVNLFAHCARPAAHPTPRPPRTQPFARLQPRARRGASSPRRAPALAPADRPKGQPKWHIDPAAPKPEPFPKRGGKAAFQIVNDGPTTAFLYWMAPHETGLGGLEPKEEIQPGRSLQMNSWVGDRFKIMGACTAAFNVPDGLATARVCGGDNVTFSHLTFPSGAVSFELA